MGEPRGPRQETLPSDGWCMLPENLHRDPGPHSRPDGVSLSHTTMMEVDVAETGEREPEGGDGGATTGDAADRERGCRDLPDRKIGGSGFGELRQKKFENRKNLFSNLFFGREGRAAFFFACNASRTYLAVLVNSPEALSEPSSNSNTLAAVSRRARI